MKQYILKPRMLSYLAAIFLTSVLYTAFPSEALAKLTQISDIYFSSEDSIVIETKNRANTIDFNEVDNSDSSILIELKNAKIDSDLTESNFRNSNYSFKVQRLKSSSRFFGSKDVVRLMITSSKDQAIEADFKEILGGLAYKIKLTSFLLPPDKIAKNYNSKKQTKPSKFDASPEPGIISETSSKINASSNLDSNEDLVASQKPIEKPIELSVAPEAKAVAPEPAAAPVQKASAPKAKKVAKPVQAVKPSEPPSAPAFQAPLDYQSGLSRNSFQANLPAIPNNQIRKASVNMSETKVYSLEKNESELDRFLKNLNPYLAREIAQDASYLEKNFRKADSASLTQLASTLATKGFTDDAVKAYRRALSLNPDNHEARIGLARYTLDKDEKLNSYLESVNSEALVNIGELWFEQGKKNYDPQTIAKSFISYQFAILKNPTNANIRFQYAKRLEEAGPEFYPQSSKRYLEAAALAKKEFLKGNAGVENLLRNSTESLIKTLVFQGDFNKASKYCNSYIKLGFSKFTNGNSIPAVMKDIQLNRNPFIKS